MLVLWLAGIWLPLHGYNFVDTPLWAGIYMLPLTAGFLLAGPVSGYAVGPVRPAAVRDRGTAGGHLRVHRPDRAAAGLPVLAVRR